MAHCGHRRHRRHTVPARARVEVVHAANYDDRAAGSSGAEPAAGKLAGRRAGGRAPCAAWLLEKSLLLRHRVRAKAAIPDCLEALAGVALARAAEKRAQDGDNTGNLPAGNEERLARLMGAVEALRELMLHPPSLTDRSDPDRTVATIRAILDEAAFAAAPARARPRTPR
jgi:hypothetical protein